MYGLGCHNFTKFALIRSRASSHFVSFLYNGDRESEKEREREREILDGL